MENTSLNFENLHHFFKGWKQDFDEHAESNQSFVKGINGRLYSNNGVLSFGSVDGTKKVYENSDIKRYMGWWAFKDELIMFTKVDKNIMPDEEDCHISYLIYVWNGTINPETGQPYFPIDWDEFAVEVCVPSTPVDENDFQTPVSCTTESDIDNYGDLFYGIPLMPLQYCPVFNNDVPINNTDYADGIWSFKWDEDGILQGTLLYVGNLNLDPNNKICTWGVHENNYYKRVYFTDYLNEFRVINLKDNKLATRRPQELSVRTTGTLLNPRLVAVENNGALAAMSVTYVYRLITQNGQVSDFSACSQMVRINKEDGDFEFSGGGISESTSKSVRISCIVPQFENFQEIELIAIEYEAKDVPTNIRSIGRKSVAFYNEFTHFGTEPEFGENITLADIFRNSIGWNYCSDLAGKNNKLIASALRNDPAYVNSKNIDIDFALHSFHWQEGETHDCLLNPNPNRYHYIDLQMSQPFMFVRKKIYRSISVLGNFWVRIENKLTGEYYQLNVESSQVAYVDHTELILEWLLQLEIDEADFAVNFPNLNIEHSQGKILFLPTDSMIQTDMYNYNLVFSTVQVLLDYDNDLQMKNFLWPATDADRNARLVYGGVSNGWFNGNGVRVTMRMAGDHVMDKNSDWFDGGGPALKLKEPSLRKGCMEGEIYRCGIQWFKNGQRLFTTILGDIKIPEIGQKRREINYDGSLITGQIVDTYQNHYIDAGDMLKASRIELQFDVRVSCELSRHVDAYQIVYVERTEENRTILAQGISAPLQRMLPFDGGDDNKRNFDDKINNKWNLPYYGGPVIDQFGLAMYDIDPNNDDIAAPFGSGYESHRARITTHRKLFYFDCPDLIYGLISDKNIDSSYMDYLHTVRTDHDLHNIAGGYNKATTNYTGTGVKLIYPDGSTSPNSTGPIPIPDNLVTPFGAPKYSQKIPFNRLALLDEMKPYFVNASVFANILRTKQYDAFTDDYSFGFIYDPFLSPILGNLRAEFTVNKSKSVEEGEILSAFQLGESFDLANAAAVLSFQGWWWQAASRIIDMRDFSAMQMNNFANGRRTVFIKTDDNFFSLFTMRPQAPFFVHGNRSMGTEDHNDSGSNVKGYDTHIISNIRRNNSDSIYGGRTEYAYSKNEYIPMSDVMPVLYNNVSSQVFLVQGDMYSTMYIRNKTSYRGAQVPVWREFNYRSGFSEYTRYGAWCYAVVLRTMIEPRLNYSEEFYRLEDSFNFNMAESHNNAYLQENNLRKSIPRPFNFKDDPNQDNMIAVSDTKLNGDYYDAFTIFRTNEFYELDKDKGAVLNLATQNGIIYAIQELQTSQIYMDERAFVSPSTGEPIQVAQGSGTSISGHEPISEFGTSIRRAVIESDFGFVFFDERKKEFIKIKTPLLLKNDLALELNQFFEDNPIIDTEGYFDFKFKETCIRFRTATGTNFIISYNEAMECFNGQWEFDNDLYPVFQERVVTPYASSSKLAHLNAANNPLSFFEQPKKKLTIGIISAPDPVRTQILKGLGIHININYPINKATFETSLGQTRIVPGTHHWYQIREGVHTIPSKNPDDTTDIRGEWAKIEIEVDSLNTNEIHIFSLINYVRNSYK